MNSILRRSMGRLGKPVLEAILPWAERLTGFRTARGDYLPNRLRMLTSRYETEELNLVRGFLAPGQIIIDVGANIGYNARFFAQAVGRAGKVYAFEPNPLIYPLLEENLADFNQVHVYNLGLSSEAGELSLFLAGNNHSVACFSEKYPAMHLVYRENETMHTVQAKVVVGDEFL